MTRARVVDRTLGLVGVAAIVTCFSAAFLFVFRDAKPPSKTVTVVHVIPGLAPTTPTTQHAPEVVCVDASGFQFRTAPDIATRYHLDCKGTP